MHKAADEMAVKATFRGYGPEHGYDFLREAIMKGDFLTRGIHLDKDEIFVNDGAKSDTGNIQSSSDGTTAWPSPTPSTPSTSTPMP